MIGLTCATFVDWTRAHVRMTLSLYISGRYAILVTEGRVADTGDIICIK